MQIKSNDEFNNIIKTNDYVVVDFYADWCGPCKMLAPTFEEVASELKDVKMIKVNIDNFEELTTQYDVQSVPTILFIKNGNVVAKNLGFIAKDNLIQKINEYK